MNITRRKFIQLSSSFTISAPFIINGCHPAPDGGKPGKKKAEDLYEGFRNPPNSSRPFVRWWWNGNRLTTGEIARELDILREAGIGGVEINPISLPQGADPSGYEAIEWLSDEWINILKKTVQTASERGIICDMIVGSGWPFGGEFLGKNEQTQLMTIDTREVNGPGTFSISKKELLDQVDPSIHSKHDRIYKEIYGIRLVPAEIDQFEQGVDMPVGPGDENITIRIPEGNHVIYFIVKLTGYQAVIHGAPGASGPVLNHYNKKAVEKYLNRMSGKLKETFGRLGDHFRAMFCDSLEIEGANWADDLPGQFEKRRGYSLIPYLPFVLYRIGHMGNPVEEQYGSRFSIESEEIIQRVRYDFYITRMELFKERFIDTFNDWCHANGVSSRVQAYGRGYHPLEASLHIDIPECETWLRETVGTEFADTGWRGRAYSVINKFVSSAGRLAGRKTISCEEITNTSRVFNAKLETVKVTGDQSNLSGVTHSVLHGFNYSPPEAPYPGWVQFGTFFSEHNPWWPYMRQWTDYKARLSSVFMKAEPYADIAILHPLADMWMKYGPQRDPFPVVKHPPYQHNVWEAIQQNGYGCDYVSEKILQEADFQDGKMTFRNRAYSAILLLETESILPATAEALEKFARAGGRIIFIEKRPRRSPELDDHANKDKKVESTVDRILGDNPGRTGINEAPSGNMLKWFSELAERYNLSPYMEIVNPGKFINQVYFRYGESDIYFISNYNLDEPYTLKVDFKKENKTAWLWDAETGKRMTLAESGAPKPMTLRFEPAETKLIVFDSQQGGEYYSTMLPDLSIARQLEGGWKVRLEHINRENKTIELEELVDFKERNDLRTFAGIIHYENTLDIPDPGQYNFLDLGEVEGVSEVSINGKDLGIKWYGFHRYPLNDSLEKGKNTFVIKVATVAGNYIKTLEDNPVSWRWINHQDFQSMGLIGPVSLLG